MISIILPCRNDSRYLEPTIGLIVASMEDPDYEIIVVDDGSEPPISRLDLGGIHYQVIRTSGEGPARARNIGVEVAKGDIIVFFDSHVAPLHGWDVHLKQILSKPEVGIVGPVVSNLLDPSGKGYGGTFDLSFHFRWLSKKGDDPYPVPTLSACAIAARRDTFLEIGGFDEGLRRWGDEDTELCLRCWLLGFHVYLSPSAEVMHLFRPAHPYPVSYLGIAINKVRIAFMHWSKARFEKSLRMMLARGYPVLLALAYNLLDEGLWKKREEYLSRRKYDDDWFCKRFAIE